MFNLCMTVLESVVFMALHVLVPEVFPKVLSKKEEDEYISLYENGDKIAKNKLIEHNLRLVAHIVKKFHADSQENEDLIAIGTIGLIKGINTFDTKKGIKLSSYISRCIENEVLMYFRTNKKTCLDVSINDPIDVENGTPLTLLETLADDIVIIDKITQRINCQKLSISMQKLKKREQVILNLRYGLSNKPVATQQEVANKLNISRSYVSRIEKKALSTLKKMFV